MADPDIRLGAHHVPDIRLWRGQFNTFPSISCLFSIGGGQSL